AAGSPAIEWMLGSWRGTRRGADDGRAVPMTVRVEPLAHGRGQIEFLRVEGQDGAAPYVGCTVRSFDPASGQWVMTYVNSTSRPFAHLHGEVGEGRSTWTSFTADRSHGSRLVCTRIDATHWQKQQFTSDDGGRSWKLLFSDELERI